VFQAQNCAQCHGGDLWTSSQVLWNLPLFDKDPANPGPPLPVLLDPRVELLGALGTAAANVVRNFDPDGDAIFQIPIIQQFGGASPTLDPADPIEMRGAGAAAGQASVGAGGSFNPPSLGGLFVTAPYGHHGRAQTLDQVFAPGGLNHPFGGTPQELSDLVQFLRSIDGRTRPF
jgi:cytochrome c peroxidase